MYSVRLSYLFSCLFVLAVPTLAQPVEVTGTLSETIFFNDPGEAEFGIFFQDPSPGTFTFDFSAVGDQEIIVTWQAPAGQFIEIAVPDGYVNTSAIFRMQTSGGFSSTGSFDATGLVLDVADPTGDPLPAPSLTYIRGSGPGSLNLVSGADFNLTAGETYRFTSLSVSGTMPAGYDQTFANTEFGQFRLIARLNDPSGLGDPGAWVSVVPEPASLALLGLGGLLVAQRRRR